jgi:transitional endoplasmic reticulum ATPase
MEEVRSPGSSDPTVIASRGTTSKLPPEQASDNNTNQETSANNDQAASSKTDESIQLVVIEGFQVGRGVARIDPSDMARLG